MTKYTPEYAIKHALELAQIVCANPNYSAQPNENSAKDLADFIRTLEARFLSGE